MIIDIRKDAPGFRAYIRRRVKEHLAISKRQKKPQPVHRIDFGFEFGQSNWAVLVFDTREDAKPDGEWTRQIDKVTMLEHPKWPIWHKLPEDEQVFFIDLKGRKVNVMKNPDTQSCRIVGDAMTHALLTVRDQGWFDPLLKTEKCEMAVDNMEGYYAWPADKNRGKDNLVSPGK